MSFSKLDVVGIIAHENDLMVIKVQIRDWSVKRVLVDPGISVDVLYWEAFKGMQFDTAKLFPFNDTYQDTCQF